MLFILRSLVNKLLGELSKLPTCYPSTDRKLSLSLTKKDQYLLEKDISVLLQARPSCPITFCQLFQIDTSASALFSGLLSFLAYCFYSDCTFAFLLHSRLALVLPLCCTSLHKLTLKVDWEIPDEPRKCTIKRKPSAK